MKKIFAAIVILGSMVCLSSCSKSCKCTGSILGVETSFNIDLEKGKKCSDYNGNVGYKGQQYVSSKCKPELF
ncbi:MAG: hypothetical protein HUJ93_02520 [Bacteroidales bacterium]|nr:hypothetical protein [Bacteroidales bacterium]